MKVLSGGNAFSRMIRKSCVALLLILISACAPYALVPASSTSVANFIVDVDSPWNKVNQPGLQSNASIAYWTADGTALNNIVFVGGVKDGEEILNTTRSGTSEKVAFRANMTPSEIVELWETVISRITGTALANGSNLQPAKFLGLDGFRFDFQYEGKDEVERVGLGYAAVKDGRLYLIFYSGTKLHHYDLRLASAKRIMESARIGA